LSIYVLLLLVVRCTSVLCGDSGHYGAVWTLSILLTAVVMFNLYSCNVYESSSKAACQVLSFGIDHGSWYVAAVVSVLISTDTDCPVCWLL